MYHSNFVHLHLHSHYSILDGAAPVKAIVEAARHFRMPAIAITDHGNMFNAIEFYQTALKKGVKPIIGFEAYFTPGSRFEKLSRKDVPTFHLVLLARNLEGYRNLVKLSTLGYTEGFYYKPRIDWELLEKYHEGLIAMGACLQGEVPYKLRKGDRQGAFAAARRYQDLFGKDNFYLEVQNHGLAEQIAVLPLIVECARACEIPLVATNDAHYVNPEDWEAQDAMLCLQTQSLLNDPNRFRFDSHEFYLKSPQAMSRLFHELPDAITNTLIVADRCNVQLSLGKSILPSFEVPSGKTSETYLYELCREALPERYPAVSPETPPSVETHGISTSSARFSDEVEKRLEFEFSVVKKMGFCDYFLIVWDFIREARAIGVPVGPGRGSAAGSIISYLLRITDIDPLKYGLLFERFLNPERISMPDIDIDFSDEGRERVIEYVVKKYGRDKVSQIITFNQILAKMAIRDIGRVMQIPLPEVDRIAKLVPEGPGVHLKKAMNDVQELRDIVENGTPEHKQLLKIASTVDGLVRHTGIHAAGVVISREPIMDIVPLYRDKSDELVTQYEKNAIEKIGLLKMDFLGLKTLSVIQRALEFIKISRGSDLDLSHLATDDTGTYDLLCKGLTMGVFQLESSGMRSLIMRLKPSVFEDIIALLAMYRPGPLGSGMVDDFVERKHGRKALAYPHNDLEPILKDTYGVFLYQEQCMHTANVLGNFTMAQADGLRKAMAKKIPEDMEKNGRMFVEGAVKRGIDREKAQSIFDLMASFGEYGFNKSHSAAYAVVTYQTAYLKAHYPVEFMAAVLSSEINDIDKISQYIEECRSMEIPILPPDLNKSEKLFSVEKGAVRFGLTAIKGVGGNAVDSMLDARAKGGEFHGLSDFARRVDTRLVNTRVIEALIKAGACDGFGHRRSQLLAISTDVLKTGQAVQKERLSGQMSFFDLMTDAGEDEAFVPADPTPPDIPELTEKERLAAEKEVLGFYLSGNPFQEVIPLARIFATHALSDLASGSGDGRVARVCGIVIGVKRHTTKKGDAMAFVTIEDDNATADISIFPTVLAKCGDKLQVDNPIFMIVKSEMLGDSLKTNAEFVFTLDDLNCDGFTALKLIIPKEKANKDGYTELMALLRRWPGHAVFNLEIILPTGERATLKPASGLRVALNPGLVKEWLDVCGHGSVMAQFPGVPAVKERRGAQFRRQNGTGGFGE
ncbi:MAG: DNA polymerase III subunit alpha [Candidatus Riflebacteria bacterium]|nr:DNA polymerase III subunit alpha [Candidatus Riflebacteria bacterium]